MKRFTILSQYLFLGCSLIGAIKAAIDGNLDMSLALVLVSFNFGFNLATHKQLNNNKANQRIDSVVNRVSDVKEHLERFENALTKNKTVTEQSFNEYQILIDQQIAEITELVKNAVINDNKANQRIDSVVNRVSDVKEHLERFENALTKNKTFIESRLNHFQKLIDKQIHDVSKESQNKLHDHDIFNKIGEYFEDKEEIMEKDKSKIYDAGEETIQDGIETINNGVIDIGRDFRNLFKS